MRTARRTLLLLALAGALATQQASALAGPATRKQVDARNSELAAATRRLKVGAVKRLGGKKARTTRVTGQDKLSLIFRQPSRGLDKGLRSNRTFQLLTAEMGYADMVPPATKFKVPSAIGEFFAGEEIMVMGDAGGGFVDADRAPAAWRGNVSEKTRLVAAVADLLMQYRDRKLANVLVNESGDVRLIDPDSTFVSRSNKPSYRSQFYAGMELGYKTPQGALADLPAEAQALVRGIASAPIRTLQATYGVDAEEAGVLQTRAKDIRDHGLDRAVESYVSTLTLKPAN